MAIPESLGLPDRRPSLRLVDRVASRGERGVAMGRDGHDGDARFAERHLAGPVNDRERFDAETLLDLASDLVEDADRHRLVRFVAERLHAPPGVSGGLDLLPRSRRPGSFAGPAEEADDRSVGFCCEAVAELGEDRARERLLAELEDAPRRLVATADRRDDRQLVAVGKERVRLRIVTVPREADEWPPGGERRVQRDEIGRASCRERVWIPV